MAKVRIRYGYRKIRVLLNREGWNVSRYLAYRLYREEGLALRPRGRRRRRAATQRRERIPCTAPNQIWGLDCVADQLADGRRFPALTVVDIQTRESLAIEAGQSLKGENVAVVLNRITVQNCLARRRPKTHLSTGTRPSHSKTFEILSSVRIKKSEAGHILFTGFIHEGLPHSGASAWASTLSSVGAGSECTAPRVARRRKTESLNVLFYCLLSMIYVTSAVA
jgi:transposase InsO family protein